MNYTVYKSPLLLTYSGIAALLWCFHCFSCTTDVVGIPEIIQTPVDLQVVAVTGGHEISFLSDNRENGFNGYGIFVAATRSELSAEPPATLSTYFCPMASQQVPYSQRIKVMVGAAAPAGYICGLPDLLLASGQFVAVRARVERDGSPWSKPVIAQVP